MFEQITDRFDTIFRNLRGLGKITDSNIRQTAREIRRVLLDADVNFRVARDFVKRVSERAEGTKVIKSIRPGEQFIKIIHEELVAVLGPESGELDLGSKKPAVILLAGLQGSGKTTTAAKLAYRLTQEKKNVILVAADMVRPAAVKQLEILGRKVGVDVISDLASTPVQVVKVSLEQARREGRDVMIIDSAGRSHVDEKMMAEIREISSVSNPQEILFVVDGMTGQDAVNSAQAFNEALELTGIILTKMDGDARGGAAVSVREVTGKPIKYLGVSEKLDGLEVFDPHRIADRILGKGDVVALVEKAKETLDVEAADKLRKKIEKNTFDLDDFRDQLRRLQKMGSMSQLLGMLPGVPRKALKGIQMDDRQLLWTEALINSMTPAERKQPQMINGSRRKRIARGAGRSVQEVNQLLKNFAMMQKMMKSMGKMKLPGLPGNMPGMGQFLGN
ncbi:MAG: signal recognition particle protein [FCB group bacterium]|nr:signal recognition particle protein [FCB group bacterium]